MKNKLLAVMATLGMVASASAVKVNNNLSINGFIDGSYALTESGATRNQGLGIDEVEINFNLNVGNVSGLVAIDTDGSSDVVVGDENGSGNGTGNAGDTLFNIEQAHFSYNVSDAVSVTFGLYGSALGFEREDPAGLYTYSRAYGNNGAADFNLGNVDASAVHGVTIAYSADTFTLAASFEEASGADLETNDLDLELSFTYTGFAGVNIGGGYLYDNEADAASETNVLNLHASKQVGKLLLAGEYSQLETQTLDRDAYLLLADYDVNDKLGVALRFSNAEINANSDYESFTIAPNYAITDSLGAIIEYSDIEEGLTDSEIYAVELTYTF